MLKGSFIEVYVNSSLEECIKRDVKGLYKKALSGEITNFIGLSKEVPFEPPVSPDVELKTENVDVKDSVETLIKYMSERDLL